MMILLAKIGKSIRRIIDLFYPPFSKLVSQQFFRYGVTGASNVFFDWILYSITYNFVLQKKIIDLPFINISISAHIGALLITFPITLLTGFLLQKYVTFTASNLRGQKQLIRYVSVVIINLLINYFGIKLLVETFKFYPTISKMIVTVICTIFSYFSQKYFTFKDS
ncbi:MAG: GtrA family protein [Proteiniphilum sp.]|nr:GtrA family protein [Proteiniphilum sp.]